MKSTLQNVFLGAVFFAGLIISSPATAGEGWIENFEAAKKQATKENKDILIDFTGSDWCGWCIRLKDEVFTKDAFKKEAPKHFVLLELDFPRGKKQSKELKAQNQELQSRFGVQGFPTIMLVDSKGRPYARTGYQRGGPESYVKHLGELRHQKHKRDQVLAEAAKADGVAKAKALDEALAGIQKNLDGREPGSAKGMVLNTYDDLVGEIIELDAKNEAGLKAKYESVRKAEKFKSELNKVLSGAREAKPEEVGAKIDALIATQKPTGEPLQQALFFKSSIYFQAGKKKEAKTLLLEAQKAAPKSATGQRINQILTQFFPDKETKEAPKK